MCGIFASLGPGPNCNAEQVKTLHRFIDHRGPDYSARPREIVTKCGLRLTLKASVLHLRGQSLQIQPILDGRANILLFNGQIYQFDHQQIDQPQADTTFLSERLAQCQDKESVVQALAHIDGPFAFIYWHDHLNTLFYGRDIFGRKSLCELWRPDNLLHPIVLSSVATNNNNNFKWLEVDCKRFMSIDFTDSTKPMTIGYHWKLNAIYPPTNKCFAISHSSFEQKFLEINSIKPLNSDPTHHNKFNEISINEALNEFEKCLLKAVDTRFKNNRQTCLKCRREQQQTLCNHSKVAVAFSGGIDSTLLALALDKTIPKDETIDLVTVAFKDNSPDRISVGQAFLELRKLSPERRWLLILGDIGIQELHLERQTQIADLISPCNTVLDDSLGCACWFISRAQGRALDSQVDDVWISNHFDTFIKYQNSSCDYPHSSKLIRHYLSPASMIFVGSGIDEQLGGYGSHRAAWRDSGTKGVFNEISFLMRRLSTRNLGRDDRVYSHHGRDVKLPYLDFDLISFLNQLPIGLKMNLDEPAETGPKKILRLLAVRWKLEESGRRIKRALQFGTRIANLENPGERGDQVCARLKPGSSSTNDNEVKEANSC